MRPYTLIDEMRDEAIARKRESRESRKPVTGHAAATIDGSWMALPITVTPKRDTFVARKQLATYNQLIDVIHATDDEHTIESATYSARQILFNLV